MIDHTFSAVSNKQTWDERIEITDIETGEAIDLSYGVDNIIVTLRDPTSGSEVLAGDLVDGTVYLLTDDDAFAFKFTPSRMDALEAKTYEIGIRIELADETAQLILGRVPVVQGL
jgi:hypothetical protein